MAQATRLQTRGICSICGKEQAVQNNNMVHHGYTVDGGFFNGSCVGTNEVHYGDVAAPLVILAVVKRFEQRLSRLPAIIEDVQNELAELPAAKRGEPRKLTEERNGIKGSLLSVERELEKHLPEAIAQMTQRASAWVKHDTFEVDVEALEKTERQARKTIADDQKAVKVEQEQEKKQRIANRQYKASEKEAYILSMQWRQAIVDGTTVEWQAEYSSERDLNDEFNTRVKAVLIEKCLAGELTPEQAYLGVYSCKTLTRTQQGKKGRQLETNPYSLRFIDIYDVEVLADVITLEKAKNAYYITEILAGNVINEYSHNNVIYQVKNTVVPANRKDLTSTVIIKNYDGEEVSRQVANGEWQDTDLV